MEKNGEASKEHNGESTNGNEEKTVSTRQFAAQNKYDSQLMYNKVVCNLLECF